SKEKLLTQSLIIPGHPRLFANDFERDRLLGAAIIGKEDLSHASFSETLSDLVATVDERACPQWRWCFPLMHSLWRQREGPCLAGLRLTNFRLDSNALEPERPPSKRKRRSRSRQRGNIVLNPFFGRTPGRKDHDSSP